MTHGTERDTPTGGAAGRDVSGAPEPTAADGPHDRVPQPHDAPEGPDGSTGSTASAASQVTSDDDSTGGPAGASQEQDGAPAPEPPVGGRLSSAAPSRESTAAWPSWEDVAVTAPPSARAEDDTDRPDGSSPGGADTQGGRTGEDDDPRAAAPAEDAAAGAGHRQRPGEPLPPLDLGGLSALAFTALNAASVGVPAHALRPPTPASPSDPPSVADDGTTRDGTTGEHAAGGDAGGDDTAEGASDETPAPVAPQGTDGLTPPGTTGAAGDEAAPDATAPGGMTADEAVSDEPAADEPPADEPAPDEVVSDDTATAGAAPVVGADAATPAETTDPTDEALDDAAPEDAAPEDAAPEDAAPDDAAPDDAAPDDVPLDVASDDVAHVDESDAVTDDASDDAVAASQAASDEPAADEPAADEPAADEPTADELTADEPTADEPAADEITPHGPGTGVVVPAAAGALASTAPSVDETAVIDAPADSSAPPAEDLDTRATPITVVPAVAGGPAAVGTLPLVEPDDREASPLDVFEPDDDRPRWPRTLAIVGGAVVLVAVTYVGASYAVADRVPRGATVAGVEIGSLGSAEAQRVLTDELAERSTAVVPVVAQDVQAELDPVAAGLTFDAEATVARLTGVDLGQPVRLWRHVAGVGEQAPVTDVDAGALRTALTQLSGSLTLAPVDGTVVFADGAAHATDAVDGWALDISRAASVLEEEWLTQSRPVTLPTEVVEPTVSQEETDRALAELARPLAAAPVTVSIADRQATLDVPTLTAHATVVPTDGVLGLQLDGTPLADAVLGQLPDLLTTAADARFEFQGGAPVVVPGTPGTTLDPTALATSVVQAVTAGTDRVAAVELVQSDPAETTAALEALGVKEIVSEFSTPLTSEPRRTRNIANGLENITGTLVRPGETFSLTEALGPVDAAHGFVQAGAIVNGEHKDAWGGGLSQVSTTAYNAAYFAGFEDVEHRPHSEWFQRYPEGREATLFTGSIDMRWKNTSPYGALVQGFVADGRAHVRIWGTKHFTVETEKSGRSGVVSPTTVYSQSRTCEPQSAGNPGFAVTNTRRVYLDGELVETTSDTWRYKPQNRIICGSAPAPGVTP